MAKSPFNPTSKYARLLRDKLKSAGETSSTSAKKWFRNRAEAIRDRQIRKKYFSSVPNERKKGRVQIGKMYYYSYNAKHKDKLPFWDRRPLIFPFASRGIYFWGINLHLAPPAMRAIIMDQLYAIANNDLFDETTKLNMNWNVLNNLSKSKYIKPCVRQYLKSHVESFFVEVPADEWEIALFLPLQRIEGGKGTAYQAYRDAL